MKMLISVLLYLTFCSGTPSHYQRHDLEPIPWNKMSEWRLYYNYSNTAATIIIDSLAALPSHVLNQDTMSKFMGQAKTITPKSTPVWMGYYVLTCKTASGEVLKVIVSQYGHFFYDPKNQQYYELNESVAREWKIFLQAQWAALESSAESKNH